MNRQEDRNGRYNSFFNGIIISIANCGCICINGNQLIMVNIMSGSLASRFVRLWRRRYFDVVGGVSS